MTLPYDVARCPGTTAPLCQGCRRTEPGRPEYQAMIAPAWDTTGCPNYIARPHEICGESWLRDGTIDCQCDGGEES